MCTVCVCALCVSGQPVQVCEAACTHVLADVCTHEVCVPAEEHTLESTCANVHMCTEVCRCEHANVGTNVHTGRELCRCARMQMACTGAGFTYRSMCANVHVCMEACRCACKGAQVQEACRCLCRADRELAHAYARACEHTFRCPQLCACAFGSNASPRDLRSTRGRSAPCASRGSGSAALHSG